MRIIYSLPHPADRLGAEQAGHTIRASVILAALEERGHEVIRVEAATAQTTQAAVGAYRGLVKKLMPRFLAMRMRDAGRIAHGRQYARRLIEVIQQTRPDVILETHIAFSLAGQIAAGQTGLPLILDDVTPTWEEEQYYGVGLKKSARAIHRQTTGQAALLIAVNETMRRHLIEEGLPASKIIVVENGIDAQFFHPGVDGRDRRVQAGLDDETLVIVYVGSFQPYHRVDLLFQAFEQLETAVPAHLLLVGGGGRKAECEALARRLGLLNRVTFAGLVPYQEVASYIAAGDIAVIPAHSGYSNPMKMYEYMALEKAIVAPNQETITEVVTHGHTAYLFQPNNAPAIAVALKTVVEDAPLRARLSREAGRFAAHQTWQKRAETIEQALHQAGIGVDRRIEQRAI